MKKLYLLLSCAFLAGGIKAQEISFKEHNPLSANAVFQGVDFSSIAFADVDGDNDADVLITGITKNLYQIAQLYKNDGSGNYSLVPNTPFEGVDNGSIAFADVDGDNDADVLITGQSSSYVRVAQLYTNDGNGQFTLLANTPFEGVDNGSIAFADADGDNDSDLLITGAGSNNNPKSLLYKNDGSGNYSLVPNTPFEGVDIGSIAFADVDNSGSPDVMITGLGRGVISKLYLNTASTFSEPAPKDLPNIGKGSVKGLNLNGINYLTLTGAENFGDSKAILYQIQNGGLYEVSNKTLDFKNAETVFEDFNGNGFPDILLAGGVNENEEVQPPDLLTYENGSYTSTPISGLPTLEQVKLSYADLLANGKKQCFLSGFDEQFNYTTALYEKIGNNFNKLNISFAALAYGFQNVLDLNNDGKNDVFISGSDENFNSKTFIYINKGNGVFETKSNGPNNPIGKPQKVDLGDFDPNQAEFFDVDNNGTLDMIAGGYNNNFDPLVKVFLNDGAANFTELNGHQLSQLNQVFFVQSDVNGDGNIDLLMTGQDDNGTQLTELYTNDGNGTFTKIVSVDFGSFYPSSALFTDINNDNKPDLIISGENQFFEPITRFFLNTSDATTGVTSFKGFENITYASPNPNQGSFKLNFGQKTAQNIIIYNAQGKVIAQYNDVQKLDVNLQVPKGLYFVQAQIGTQVHNEKIVIE